MLSKTEKRKMTKLKKKINELFIMGEITQQEAEAMAAGEMEMPGTSKEDNTTGKERTSNDNNNMEEIAAINKKLTQAREKKQPGPMLNLTLEKLGGSYLSHQEIRDLMQFSVIGPVVSKPKWAFFRPWKSTSQTILLRVNCPDDYIENNQYSFKFVDDFFSKKWIRMHKEVGERVEFWKHMIKVPVSIQEQIREKIVKLKNAETSGEPVSKILKKELMMTTSDMVENDYPWPVGENICTKDRYKPITADSPVFFLDCEMCKTGNNVSELTRISLIREDGSIVFDTLVKPYNEITDYVTKFSGITPEMLEDVDVRLSDVHKAIRAVLPPDAIICGHSLEFDFRAMKMCHPYCIDIGLIYNISGNRRIKTALRTLVYLFLGKDIQNSTGHCSVQDSHATLDLFRLKTENGLIFGNVEFGWNYDEWNKKKDEEMRARIDEEMRKAEIEEEIPKKKRRVEYQPFLCQCGRKINIECIVENCRCQKAPANKCIFCLSEKEPVPSEDSWIDWGNSLLKNTGDKYRPLAYYLCDNQKTVMFGYENCKKTTVENTKNYTFRIPSKFASLDEYVKEVSGDMLQYKLSMIELDYMKREDELIALADTEEGSEEGELPGVMPIVVNEIDGHLQKIIESAAKYSLIILILSSPAASVCYLKVKP